MIPQKLYPYGKEKPFELNGKRRYGQFEWHNENCQIQHFGINSHDRYPLRSIWCATHGQWAFERPVKVTWEFEDGTKIEKSL